ncbi:MAG: primosomal protein N' [Planctomycetota bacterium]
MKAIESLPSGSERIVEVAVNVPVRRPFHYKVPQALSQTLQRGHRVLVPFGPRTTTGVCVGFPDRSEYPKLKPVRELLHPDCRFDEHLLELTRWIATYYRASWGEVLESALPPSIRQGKAEKTTRYISPGKEPAALAAEAESIAKKAKARSRVLRFVAENPDPHVRSELIKRLETSSDVVKKLVEAGWLVESETIERKDPYETDPKNVGPGHELNRAQNTAIEAIDRAVASGEFRPQLLHGITGSGKTEVYIHALQHVIDSGKRGLVMVPEIALTPQTVRRFREGLPHVRTAILHSMLSSNERTGQWKEIQEGKAQLIIGARSAAFAPIPNLGLIVVDEEHEPSYKQESAPKYNGRDVAVVRAQLLSIPVVLGSATPSLESMQNAKSGKYELIELRERATSHDLPNVSIVPLEKDFYRSDGGGLVGRQLDYQIKKRLKNREQVLIFLNRRGFATYLHCTRCGFVLKCKNCDVTMTFHRKESTVRCHYCGFMHPVPDNCPDCGMPGPRKSGAGTEKVVEALSKKYPDARIGRLDRDAVTTHSSLKETLSRFAAKELDMLVGTQMIAKGHDFPGVSLVGILLADSGLHLPDFRAAERTFQLLTQVAGRAGRGDRPGQVIVQTFFPDHYAIRFSADGNYSSFADKELGMRKTFGYPPFGRLAKVVVSGTDEEKVRKESVALGEELQSKKGEGVQVLGPVPSPIARIQTRHRMQVLIKASKSSAIHTLLDEALPQSTSRRGADISVDIDPQSLL